MGKGVRGGGRNYEQQNYRQRTSGLPTNNKARCQKTSPILCAFQKQGNLFLNVGVSEES